MRRARVQMVLAGKERDLQLAGPSHILHNHCDFKILVRITPIAPFEALRAVTGTGRNPFWDQKLLANPLLALLKGDSECGAGQAGGAGLLWKFLRIQGFAPRTALGCQDWD